MALLITGSIQFFFFGNTLWNDKIRQLQNTIWPIILAMFVKEEDTYVSYFLCQIDTFVRNANHLLETQAFWNTPSLLVRKLTNFCATSLKTATTQCLNFDHFSLILKTLLATSNYVLVFLDPICSFSNFIFKIHWKNRILKPILRLEKACDGRYLRQKFEKSNTVYWFLFLQQVFLSIFQKCIYFSRMKRRKSGPMGALFILGLVLSSTFTSCLAGRIGIQREQVLQQQRSWHSEPQRHQQQIIAQVRNFPTIKMCQRKWFLIVELGTKMC